MGVRECYTAYNPQGSVFGNCGYTSTNYIPCSQRFVYYTKNRASFVVFVQLEPKSHYHSIFGWTNVLRRQHQLLLLP